VSLSEAFLRTTDTFDHQEQFMKAPISSQPDTYQLQFVSRLASARNPDAWQRNFALILTASELEALKSLIDGALQGHIRQ
jgi:hypothetical protein